MGVRWASRIAAKAHGWKVVDVVSDEECGLERERLARREVSERGRLVAATVDAGDAQLFCAAQHDRVGLCGQNKEPDIGLAENIEADAVPPVAANHLPPILVHPDPVIGEHSVEVEDDGGYVVQEFV